MERSGTKITSEDNVFPQESPWPFWSNQPRNPDFETRTPLSMHMSTLFATSILQQPNLLVFRSTTLQANRREWELRSMVPGKQRSTCSSVKEAPCAANQGYLFRQTAIEDCGRPQIKNLESDFIVTKPSPFQKRANMLVTKEGQNKEFAMPFPKQLEAPLSKCSCGAVTSNFKTGTGDSNTEGCGQIIVIY